MSHVDDGILHAYLDGELPPLEREQVEGHLAGCPQCRIRLGEERALIERAGWLLDLVVPAAPPSPAPPLHRLRRQRTWRHVRLPLVWAATVVLAVGLGWYLRGGPQAASERAAEMPVAAAAPTSSARQPATEAMQSVTGSAAPRPLGRNQPSPVAAVPNRETRPAAPPAVAAKAVAQSPNELEAAAVDSVAGRLSAEIIPTNAAPSVADNGRRQRLDRTGLSSTTSTAIDSTTAHGLLGTAPVTIPGYPVRMLRRGPGPTPEVAVEQELSGGVLVVLIERMASVPSDGARREMSARDTNPVAAPAARTAHAVSERLARFIGPLRVEISGALPADSLARLLELVR